MAKVNAEGKRTDGVWGYVLTAMFKTLASNSEWTHEKKLSDLKVDLSIAAAEIDHLIAEHGNMTVAELIAKGEQTGKTKPKG